MTTQYTVEDLKKWADAYYNDQNLVSDETFDKVYDELKALYPNDPYFKSTGAKAKSQTVPLRHTMGSLNKLHPDTVVDWVKDGICYLITPKLDGLTMQLIYKKGQLVEAYTRGDGVNGSPILNRAMYMGGVPKSISSTNDLDIIEGECIIYKSIFDKYYASEYAFPRNFCVGTLRPAVNESEYKELLKDESLQNRLKRMQFVAFRYVTTTQTKKSESLKELATFGFSTVINPQKRLTKKNEEDLANGIALPKCKSFKMPIKQLVKGKDILTEDYFKQAIDLIKSEDFDIVCDGIVIEYNSLEKQAELGNETGSLNPKSGRAVKHKQVDQVGEYTTIENIEWNISKRGNFVPRAVIKPVKVEGATITYATANNFDMVKTNGLGIGSQVKIVRSGDVIPLIVEVKTKGVSNAPTKCPYCGADLVVKGVHLHCPNKHCSGRKLESLQSFFEIAKADFVSTATVKDFVQKGLDLKKILSLTEGDLLNIGYKETMAKKISKSIKTMESGINLATLMHAMGTFADSQSGLGATKLQVIIDLLTPQAIVDNSVDKSLFNKIVYLDGFSDRSADMFINGYDDFQALFQDVKSLFTIKDLTKSTGGKLTGMTFCETGFRSKQLEQLIEDNGGVMKSSVVNNLSVLFSAGDSSKTQKAIEKGVKVVSMVDAIKYIESLL